MAVSDNTVRIIWNISVSVSHIQTRSGGKSYEVAVYRSTSDDLRGFMAFVRIAYF
jgi:hypothetical protein